MQRALLVVNPYASAVNEARVRAVAAELERVFALETVETERPGHATEVVRAADEADAVFVFSGDGGFNEVLNGLERDVPVGFVPGGGANVLSRALGLPRDPVGAARRLAEAAAEGRTRRISLGRVNGRRFGFGAGLGLDAEAVRRVEALGRSRDGGRAGNFRFALALGRVLAERRGRFEPVLEVSGRGRAAFALVANTDPYTYAGPIPIHLAPEARFELGLDLVAPRAVSPLALPRYLGYVLLGRGQQTADDVIYGHDLDRIEVRCETAMPLQADGEDLGNVEHVIFEAERGAVRVLD